MSTDKKKHDFHLVDPSPWPIYVSFATLVLAVGAVYYFHSKALWLLLVGFALVVTSCALIGGFMVLASSGFRVNSDLAQLSMITIAFAIIADFLFLPPLLMKLENLKNKNKKD